MLKQTSDSAKLVSISKIHGKRQLRSGEVMQPWKIQHYIDDRKEESMAIPKTFTYSIMLNGVSSELGYTAADHKTIVAQFWSFLCDVFTI